VNDFRVTTFVYDARDRMTGRTDADPDTTSGNGNTPSSSYSYDDHNRLLSVVDAEGGTTSYGYAVGVNG